ncbi:serine hydrolase [uncultured Eudoraea sp.]|uniref:serine hydrolase n=1 Tax=uncultured Eudoraea sp. TaxID=1035614 RepID=UPI0026031AF4|nr:serine hydrolase [uncultured Eudoraea sp.]
MNHCIAKSGITLLLIFISVSLNAQFLKGKLSQGNPIFAEILPNETHQYKVNMGRDQFAFFKLMQRGVDLKITTYDASGNKISDFDSPNGKNGYEYITLTSTIDGEYIVEIYPLDEHQPNGKYEISLEKIKPRAETLNGQVDELFTVWDNKETPGASVAIVKNGSIIYKKGYGMANLEYDIPIVPSTIFHIASVSKQFTVFSILLLESEGKLTLDDDIRKFIPAVPDFGKTITLRHLANHTSGLRDQWNLLAMAGWRLDDVITKEQVLKLVSRQKELNFEPGEEYMYCNTGFTLLAEVVARVSGVSFATFTKERIFKPLNMVNTLFYDDHEKIVKNRAYSYYSDSSGYKKSVLNYANVGATSLFTTVEDLSLWALNFSSPKIGSPELFAKMNTPAVLKSGKTFGGALGQFVGKYKGLNEIQHGGADAGYRSYLTRFPDQNFSVAVFSNDASFSSGSMAHKIVDIYLKDYIKTASKENIVASQNTNGKITLDKETITFYLGDYELQPGFIISITEDSGELFAQASGQEIVNLIPLSQKKFKVSEVEAEITFNTTENEKAESIKLEQGGQIMNAPRIIAFDKSTVDLSQFSGSFYSEELSTEYKFMLAGDKLIAKHSRHSDIVLDPVKQDTFTGSEWFFKTIEFTRDSDKKISGCKVSSGRVRNLQFLKK